MGYDTERIHSNHFLRKPWLGKDSEGLKGDGRASHPQIAKPVYLKEVIGKGNQTPHRRRCDGEGKAAKLDVLS